MLLSETQLTTIKCRSRHVMPTGSQGSASPLQPALASSSCYLPCWDKLSST